MKRIPRPVLRALEALAQSPINTSALAMAEGQDFAHDWPCSLHPPWSCAKGWGAEPRLPPP